MVKNLPAMQNMSGDMGSNHGSGISSGGWHGNPLQYSCLENPMDRGDWWATVYRVANIRRRLKQLITQRQNWHIKGGWIYHKLTFGL